MNLNIAASAPIEPPAIDPSSIAELRALSEEGGEDVLGRLIQMFFEDVPQALADLGAALTSADAPAIARLAHTVKGSGGYFGAYRFQELCGAIEAAGRSGHLGPVAELLASAHRELQRVTVALAAERPLSPL